MSSPSSLSQLNLENVLIFLGKASTLFESRLWTGENKTSSSNDSLVLRSFWTCRRGKSPRIKRSHFSDRNKSIGPHKSANKGIAWLFLRLFYLQPLLHHYGEEHRLWLLRVNFDFQETLYCRMHGREGGRRRGAHTKHVTVLLIRECLK